MPWGFWRWMGLRRRSLFDKDQYGIVVAGVESSHRSEDDFYMPLQYIKLLFAIADAEHVRFVRPAAEDNTLHSASRVKPEDGHAGEASHPHNQHKEKFAAWVAEQLNQNVGTYDELVLVAPPHVLGVIRDHLGKAAEAKLVGRLDRDLTKISDHDLWPHVKHWVRPVRRVVLD